MSVSKKTHSSSLSLPGARPSEAQPLLSGVAATASHGAPPLPPVTDARTPDARLPGQRGTALKKGQKRPQDAEEEVLLDNTDLAGDAAAEPPVDEWVLAQAPGEAAVATDAGAGAASEAAGSTGASTAAGTASTAPVAAAATLSTSGLVLGGVALAAVAGGGGGGNNPSDPGGDTSPSLMGVTGKVTAGQSMAGLVVQAYDKDGKAIAGARAVTDENGSYTLSIDRQYAGQTIVLKVTDPDATDGRGYIDEATGESKDFGTALRAAVSLGTTETQVAQITPLTELAARKLVNDDGTVSKSASEVTATNKAVGALFGVDDPVGGEAPNVVGKGDGDTGSTAGSNDYGKALALLSGMDAVNERLGAADPMAATLERLDKAINVSLSGNVSATFQGADVDAMNLLSQAVAEVRSSYTSDTDTSLVDALSNIALDVAKTGAGSEVAVLLTSSSNLLGAGKTATVNFQFDSAPTQDQYNALLAAIQVQGASLSGLQAFDASKTQYSATLTQLGSEEPRVWLADDGNASTPAFFANELRLQLDTQAPTLNIARIEGLRGGVAQSVVKQGDVLRVTLSSDEPVVRSGEAPTLTLNIGGSTVDATLNPMLSGTRNLVFEYTVSSETDTDGVSVASLNLGNGSTLRDFAGNDAAPLNTAYSGMAPMVDTTAPVVLSQSPADDATVGNAGAQTITLNFSEAVSKGTGTLTLKRGDTVVQTIDVGSGTLSPDGMSLSFSRSGTLQTGQYTIEAQQGTVRDLAGNAWGGAGSGDDSWNFTVGAVNLGVNKLSTDNILSSAEAGGTEETDELKLSGTLAGATNLLESISAGDLQVWLRPAAGGAAVAATDVQINEGTWSASVANASALSGGYVVQAIVNKGGIAASASGVLVIDRSAQMSLATLAGDDKLSLLEQSILKSSSTGVALGFVAEKGARGSLTLSKGDVGIQKTFTNATGLLDNSLRLTKEDLAALGTGDITVTGKVTDVAGNEATISKTLVIEAAAVPATITQVALNALAPSPLGVGDKLVAQLSFDKAVALSGTDATLALQVGQNTRNAQWVGLSADRKTLSFEYTVAAGDMDSDGVSIAANALNLNTSTLKDLSGTAAVMTHAALENVSHTRVDTTVIAAPDLTGAVTEAGIDGDGSALAGVASTGGKLVTASGVTVTSVSVNGQSKGLSEGSTATSLTATTIAGTYGTWTVGADGSYRYSLNNNDANTQRLAAGQTATDTLSFTLSSQDAGQAVVTVTGSNDAPISRVKLITQGVSEGTASASLDLLQGVTDPDGDTLSVTGLSYRSYKVGSNIPGSGSSELPAGLTLNGTTLSLDPGHSAFDSLKAGEQHLIIASYTVEDGKGGRVRQEASFTVNGANDEPTVSAALTRAVNEDAASVSLDLLAGASDKDGDALRLDAIQYSVDEGAASNALPAGLSVQGSLLTLDPGAFNSLKAGEQKTITARYNVIDSQGDRVAQTATFTVTGSNDAPAVTAALSQTATEGGSSTRINLLAGASDVDGDTLSVSDISYKVGDAATGNSGADLPAGLSLSGSTLSLDPGHSAFNSLKAGQTQTLTASYTVSDGQGGSVAQTATFTVTGSNDAPTAQGSVAAQTALKGTLYSLDVASYFADVDVGDTRSYALSGQGASGLSIDADGRITGTLGAAREAQTVTVTMTDGSSASVSQSFDLRVVDQLSVSRIYASEVGASAGKAGDVLRLVVQFSEAVTINGVPTLTLDVNGTAVTATFEQMVSVGDLAYFTATVPANNNGNAISVQAIHLPPGASVVGSTSGTSLLTTAVNQSTPSYLVDNSLPVITTTTLSVAENDTAVGSLAATDASALSWALAEGGQDNDLFAVSSSGVVTLKAPKNFEADARGYSVSVKATDAVGNASTQTLTVNLTDVNEAPTALALNNPLSALAENASTSTRTKVADIGITDDALGVNTISLVGADKDAFEVDGQVLYLKAGVGLDYEAKSSYSVSVQVQDNALTTTPTGGDTTGPAPQLASYTLNISNANDAPIASALAAQTIRVGQSWTGYQVPAFTDQDGDALSYTATLADGSALPSWLLFDAATRSFSVSGTSSLTAQTLSVRVTANDGTASASADFALNVRTTPILASVSSADKAIVSGLVSDTFTFKFNGGVNVDTLEAAFASGKVKVVGPDGSTRLLGDGARVEGTYPTAITVSGFSVAADGSYSTLWLHADNKNSTVPSFSGFSTTGLSLTADANYPIYKHTDSTGNDWYLWRPLGAANYVLTPESSVIANAPQSWWASGNGSGTGTTATPREGVVLAGEWYANSGQLSSSQAMWRSDNKLGAQPSLEASAWGTTFTLALGANHGVQQGDTLRIDAGAAVDTSGNTNTSELSIGLPADSTRPVLGEATVKGLVWDNQSGSYVEAPSTQALVQGNLIRVEIPVSETLRLYYPGGSTGSVALDIGGQTRYATLNLQLSSATGSTPWGFSSNKLVYEYWVQGGDNDTQGGITVGTMNRGNVGMYDAAGNRPWTPNDVVEAANTLSVVDNRAPHFWLSYASGSTVVLQADEALDATNLPSASAFSVMVGANVVAVQSVAVIEGNTSYINSTAAAASTGTGNRALVLSLASPLTAGQSVKVSYTDPSSGNDARALQDRVGNDAASIIDYVITAVNAPSIQYTGTSFDKVELAGDSQLHFTVKYNDAVLVSGTPRLTLQVSDGTTTSTVYANFQPYSDVGYGQLDLGFVYRPAAGVKGQVSVIGLDLNGGSITAYNSAGAVAANTTLNNSSFFTPFTWIYPEGMLSATGDASNNLLAPWMGAPENTPHALSASSATGGGGTRDVLAMTVLLPASVITYSAAQAYSLSYNVTGEGVRQVLLKNGSTTVDTYTVPADADWPSGVEQLLYHAVYKNSAGQVQFADIDNIHLTLGTYEYIDPVNTNQRWFQGSLKAETINMTGRDAAQTIFIEGEQGDDTIVGHDGVDLIRGGGGNNLISAGKGDDQVIIRRGSDSIDGGEGADTLRFDLAGHEKKITVDADGVIHVYSATSTWSDVFVPDANVWVERYRLSTDYGTDGSNRIGVFDVALGRNVAMAKNMERLQWRLDENSSGRSTNTFKIGTSGDDSLSEADVVLAGAGNDTITLTGAWLHADDWRYGNRALLVDGGSGRDVLQLNSYANGLFSQAFEWSYSPNPSRVLKNIEGLNLTAGGYIELAAADIVNLYASDSNLNAWGSEISGLNSGMRQFLITGTSGSINLSDTSGWVRKTDAVTYNNQSHAVVEHASTGVQLVVDSRISTWGGVSNEGGSTLSISSQTSNGQINEGNNSEITNVSFTVTRSGDTSGTSSATWNLVSGSTNSEDFATGQPLTGTVEFAPGESSKTVVVKVRGDTIAEANESFGVRLSNASMGTALSSAETWVTINNDDGEYVGTGPAPTVQLVRADTREFVGPGSSLHFVVELDQTVAVSGTPRLSLTLTDPTGSQRKVYADFVRYSDSNGTWNVQSSMEFVYNYNLVDAVGSGWTYHIDALENNNGSTIKSVESQSYNVAANLTLNNVGPTSITWLYTSEVDGTTGTPNNDGLFGFEALLDSNNVPRSLDANSANGGPGDRDLLGIPVLLPSDVTTLAEAKTYYLRYEVTSDGRVVKLYQSGNSTPVDSYAVPLTRNDWPTEVEALAYYLKFKDVDGNIQETDHPNDHLVFWKSGYTATDAVNGDISRQGSYLNDTIDLSGTPTETRTFVRGNQGNDILTGHDGTDVLFGDGGDDVVNAGAGNDFVALGAGADTLDGGTGIDILGLWVRGQEAMPSFSADGKLQVLSAFGTWSMNNFTPDNSGFQLDWVLDFNGQTGALMARHASSTLVSTATQFEKMRIYHDQYQLVRGETTGTFDVAVGTSGNDILNTTPTLGILHGLDGDDTINAATQGTPVMMGGNGNDTFVLGAVVFGSDNDNDLFIHGGAGTDTLRAGADIAGFNFTRPYAGTQLRSIEAIDLTGSTAPGAQGNTLVMTADWLQDLTDMGSTRSLMVTGDANDRVSLAGSEGWSSSLSDQSGYNLYQTQYANDSLTLKLYIATAMANTVIA